MIGTSKNTMKSSNCGKRKRQNTSRMTGARSIRTTFSLKILLCLASGWVVYTSAAATPLDAKNAEERILQQTTPSFSSTPIQGLQSHFGANSFAGGMVIPSTNPNIAYIAGQAGAYNCFIGAVSLSSLDRTLRFISKQILEGAICQTLALNSKESQLLLLATAEEGGLFTETRATGSTKATQYGLVAPLMFDGNGGQATLQPGLLLHDDVVQYPKALVTDPFHEDFAYLVSMHSESKEENTHTTIDSEPNFTYLKKYGSAYFITIRRILYNDQRILPNNAWSKEYAVRPQNDGTEEADVVVSNMIHSKGNLLLVGYTGGSGAAFGETAPFGETALNADNLITGFVTKFDTETGLVQDQPTRISLGTSAGSFTRLHDVCSDSNDAAFVYVTAFTGEQDIILIKLHAQTLEIEWQTALNTDQNVPELLCAVDETEGVVYMAGVVPDGGIVSDEITETVSFGRDDVFVAQIQTDSGSVNWLRQLGTTKDDRVASIQILTSKSTGGGILMFGDSSGSLLATVTKNTEIWMAQITMDGSMPITTESSNDVSNDGGTVPIGQPNFDDSDQTIPPVDVPIFPNTPPDGGSGGGGGSSNGNDNFGGGEQDTGPSGDDDDYLPEADDDADLDKHKKSRSFLTISIFIVPVSIIIVLAVSVLIIIRRRQILQNEKETERAVVFSYLQAFEPEDMDVRRSATGGWHGTYVGKLHKGGSTAPGEKTAISKDNSFVDYDLGSPVRMNREPRRNFVIDDDDHDDLELKESDNIYRNRYKADGDRQNEDEILDDHREMDAVDIRIGRIGEDDDHQDGTKPWGKEIV